MVSVLAPEVNVTHQHHRDKVEPLISGVSGNIHESFLSWYEAECAYTLAYALGAVCQIGHNQLPVSAAPPPVVFPHMTLLGFLCPGLGKLIRSQALSHHTINKPHDMLPLSHSLSPDQLPLLCTPLVLLLIMQSMVFALQHLHLP